MNGYGCLLAFDSDDPEFVRGFEAGRLWALLRNSPDDLISEHVHSSNVEMVMRMAETMEREVASEELNDEWLIATFKPTGVLDSAVD